MVLVDARSLLDSLTSTSPPVLLDIRWRIDQRNGRSDYLAAHLPGALYVDLETELSSPPTASGGRHPLPAISDLQASVRRWGVHSGSTVVVYDDFGGMSAARAWWLLRWAGLNDVRLLDGGLARWRALNLPLEAGQPPATPGNVVLTPGAMPTIHTEQIAEFATAGVLLDARAAERYRGEVEPFDPRAGHIPGALSAPTDENLDVTDRFLSPGQLRARFAALGVRDGTPVAVYCGSGITAAHEIVALALAGFNAVLYPGSWSAWSADPTLTVAVGPEP
ncbi:MAG: sulfurtransferase [Solirubrobacteraceae bacterium]